jgi:hypothetical protein
MYRKTIAVSAFILTTSIAVSAFILAATFVATDLLWVPTIHAAAQRDDSAAISPVTLQPTSRLPMQCRKTATRTT